MIISGKEISKKIKEQLKVEVEEIKNKYNRLPKLAVILVGENQASQVYVRNKERGNIFANGIPPKSCFHII